MAPGESQRTFTYKITDEHRIRPFVSEISRSSFIDSRFERSRTRSCALRHEKRSHSETPRGMFTECARHSACALRWSSCPRPASPRSATRAMSWSTSPPRTARCPRWCSLGEPTPRACSFSSPASWAISTCPASARRRATSASTGGPPPPVAGPCSPGSPLSSPRGRTRPSRRGRPGTGEAPFTRRRHARLRRRRAKRARGGFARRARWSRGARPRTRPRPASRPASRRATTTTQSPRGGSPWRWRTRVRWPRTSGESAFREIRRRRAAGRVRRVRVRRRRRLGRRRAARRRRGRRRRVRVGRARPDAGGGGHAP